MTTSPRHDDAPRRRGDGSPGFAVWLTGLPASGKTTIARELRSLLRDAGADAELLDSDELRRILTPRPTYDEQERDLFYASVACIGSYLVKHGVNVLIAATANRRRYRDNARGMIDRFMEVFVSCDLATCEARDPKGLYKEARRGEVSHIPGLQRDYEPPLRPEVVIGTDHTSPAQGAAAVFAALRGRGWVRGGEPNE